MLRTTGCRRRPRFLQSGSVAPLVSLAMVAKAFRPHLDGRTPSPLTPLDLLGADASSSSCEADPNPRCHTPPLAPKAFCLHPDGPLTPLLGANVSSSSCEADPNPHRPIRPLLPHTPPLTPHPPPLTPHPADLLRGSASHNTDALQILVDRAAPAEGRSNGRSNGCEAEGAPDNTAWNGKGHFERGTIVLSEVPPGYNLEEPKVRSAVLGLFDRAVAAVAAVCDTKERRLNRENGRACTMNEFMERWKSSGLTQWKQSPVAVWRQTKSGQAVCVWVQDDEHPFGLEKTTTFRKDKVKQGGIVVTQHYDPRKEPKGLEYLEVRTNGETRLCLDSGGKKTTRTFSTTEDAVFWLNEKVPK